MAYNSLLSNVVSELPFDPETSIALLEPHKLPKPYALLDKVLLSTLTGMSSAEGVGRDVLSKAVARKAHWEQEKARLQAQRDKAARERYDKTPEGKIKIKQMSYWEHWERIRNYRNATGYHVWSKEAFPDEYEPLAQLYDRWGTGGNLDIGLGRKRVITNGTERNNGLNYKGQGNKYKQGNVYLSMVDSPVWPWPKNLTDYDREEQESIFNFSSSPEYREVLPKPLGEMFKGDNLIYLGRGKVHEFSKTVEYINTEETIKFAIEYRANLVMHHIFVKDMIGYMVERPLHYLGDVFKGYTSGQVAKIVNS